MLSGLFIITLNHYGGLNHYSGLNHNGGLNHYGGEMWTFLWDLTNVNNFVFYSSIVHLDKQLKINWFVMQMNWH